MTVPTAKSWVTSRKVSCNRETMKNLYEEKLETTVKGDRISLCEHIKEEKTRRKVE